MRLLKKKQSTKSKKDNWIDWLILFFISGFVGPFCLHKYDDATNGHNMKILYLGAGMIILWLFSAAKLGFFNVFKGVRKTPKFIKELIFIFKNDYTNWRNKTGYYEKK